MKIHIMADPFKIDDIAVLEFLERTMNIKYEGFVFALSVVKKCSFPC